ncbi:hypothetical protein Bbelb_411470 [Branchiostoma belcheri]|nr:hypothetical protein Bbelb_411470 [Branchiostoma belcheri]
MHEIYRTRNQSLETLRAHNPIVSNKPVQYKCAYSGSVLPDEQNNGVYFVNPGKMCDVTDQMITQKREFCITYRSVQDIIRESAGYLPDACRRPTKEADARPTPEPDLDRPGLHLRRAPAGTGGQVNAYCSFVVGIIREASGTLEKVEDFKYLGSHMESTAKDINSRKAAAWRACNKMDKIWKSDLSSKLKTRLFLSTVESVLLYGCEAWTFTPKLEKQLDGCYTRMLRRVHNVHWEQHLTNKELYAGLPKLTTKIRARRLRFAGHTLRNCREIASNLVLWSPAHGGRRPGRPPLTYPDVLRRDVGLRAEDMGKAMEDKDYWAAIVVRVAEEEWHPT